ncbi:MAG: metallophosphoesterase [candidate division WOR-3 bacterium]|nr:metallophosphoesterase [candidate division WOR-3 bacterium]
MKEIIGIISDTHDNLSNVLTAAKIFNQFQTSLVIHCGDYVAPFTLAAFKELKCPLIGVLGNCDGEQEGLMKQAQQLKFEIYPSPHKIELNHRQILISHKPVEWDKYLEKQTNQLSNRPIIDIFIYGHTHKPEIKRSPILIINPGEASGWLFQKPSIAILNLATDEVEIIPIN